MGPLKKGNLISKMTGLPSDLYCRDCRETPEEVVEDIKQGDMICGKCGLVLSNGRLIDTGSEWRNFADDSGDPDPSRVGGAVDPNTGQLESTTISFRDGKSGASAALSKAHRMATDNDKSAHALREAYSSIVRFSEQASLSRPMIDLAKQLYFLLSQKFPTKSTDDAGIAACVYTGAKMLKGERTFKEISALTSVPVKAIGKRYKLIHKIIADEQAKGKDQTGGISGAINGIGTAETVNVASMIPRFSSLLDLSPEARKFAILLTERVEKKGILAARQPNTIAGACLLCVVGLSPNDNHVKGKRIADVVGITPSTLVKILGMVLDNWDQLIKPGEMPRGMRSVEEMRNQGISCLI
ncbi:hypothetical protein SeMB42_g00006 [Synchytrium endobioticum]|uniref:General transcription factor TFIIB n=1 Tax=Synchytrium endobioticum TaxID=286115 RepID=A0A507DAK1_9FUNG|nr:hypothetical protein SeLEV6574_g02071 [Synchytrium endobioticum]TPX55028.1 hypothetical protein SeMB42_g00006 [Synchytrium endobioticum]